MNADDWIVPTWAVNCIAFAYLAGALAVLILL